MKNEYLNEMFIPGTGYPKVQFTAVQAKDIDMIAGWMENEKIHQWLDMGGGRQLISKMQLHSMLMSQRTCARLFGVPGGLPIGLICIHDIDNLMGSADMWGLRGVYAKGPSNVATAAALVGLATGYLDYGREVMRTWVVDGNHRSLLIHRKLGLREVGKARSCHVMNGKRYDRYLFDMTRDEFANLYPEVPSESGKTFRALSRAFSTTYYPMAVSA